MRFMWNFGRKRRRSMRCSTLSSFSVSQLSLFSLVAVVVLAPVVIEASVLQDVMNRAYSLLGYETCEHPNVMNPKSAVKRLRETLKKELFGQHLAHDVTLTAVKAHLDDPSPSKALVLSFHGWAGAGKTFTSQKLIDSLYKEGINSSFIRFFQSSYHFPDDNVTTVYQELIKRNVEEVVRHCPRALFIFDEVDKTPPGVLDALVPYIHHPGTVLDKQNYKHSIFVFLSNTGASEITRIAQEAWLEGKRREELEPKDFETVLSNEAFNSKSGLYRSRIIDKVLVDYFVPYLPLERHHIISCIKVAAKKHGMAASTIDMEAEKIADMLTYWPADTKLYSTTGCKKVDTFVKYRMSEIELNKYKPQGNDNKGDEHDDHKSEL